MSVNVDPFVIPIPQKWLTDPDLAPTVQYLWRFLYDLWRRTGGGDDAIASVEDSALYDVGIKGAEIAEITKDLGNIRAQMAFLDAPDVSEITKAIDDLKVLVAMIDRPQIDQESAEVMAWLS